ncbi:MAG: hypothetical protein N2651_02095 [Fimbriimonadales bacterium]|nr:hypothetical protein [Fimbriimonadales bacterium]
MNKLGLILALAALLGAGAAAIIVGAKGSETTPTAVVSTPEKSACCSGHNK